ncbi:MAG: GtrA family protein [Pseudomonadota bacterium]
MNHRRAVFSEGVRFLCVSIFGVLIDLSIAFGLATYASAPLWIAATVGFLVAALVNYGIHELWTFRQGARALSMTRSLKYLTVSTVTLLSRIAVVVPLEHLLPNRTLVILLCGAGVSFFVNFALSKFVVFASSSTETKTSP